MPTTTFATVFLDRDGVINRDSSEYVKRWEEFLFLPRSIDAIARLTSRGLRIILITNQSIIGRGWVPPSGLEEIHRRMTAAIADQGGRIDAIYFCPHHPDDGCGCRKPEPGLIFRARQEHGLELSRSVMIGDSAKDIGCARRAGCGAAILVKTGNYAEAKKALDNAHLTPDVIAEDLWTATDWVLARTAIETSP